LAHPSNLKYMDKVYSVMGLIMVIAYFIKFYYHFIYLSRKKSKGLILRLFDLFCLLSVFYFGIPQGKIGNRINFFTSIFWLGFIGIIISSAISQFVTK